MRFLNLSLGIVYFASHSPFLPGGRLTKLSSIPAVLIVENLVGKLGIANGSSSRGLIFVKSSVFDRSSMAVSRSALAIKHGWKLLIAPTPGSKRVDY